MEEEKHFYEEEEERTQAHRVSSLEREVAEKDEQLKQQELLLEELYKLVYHKRAWLTLSDDNIRGMQKVVGRLPVDEQHGMPKTSEEYDKTTWGV